MFYWTVRFQNVDLNVSLETKHYMVMFRHILWSKHLIKLEIMVFVLQEHKTEWVYVSIFDLNYNLHLTGNVCILVAVILWHRSISFSPPPVSTKPPAMMLWSNFGITTTSVHIMWSENFSYKIVYTFYLMSQTLQNDSWLHVKWNKNTDICGTSCYFLWPELGYVMSWHYINKYK